MTEQMSAITGYTIGFPPDWYRWEVGTGAQVVDSIVDRAADTDVACDTVRRGVLGLDELCVREEAAILVAALWLPDRTTGGTVATARLELLVNPGVPDLDEHRRLAQHAKAERGMKVFDRVVDTMDLPAGRALTVVTTLAEKSGGLFSRGHEPQLVETRIDVTVFPPGSSDTLSLHSMTVDQGITESLGEQVRAALESLTVTLGEADGA